MASGVDVDEGRAVRDAEQLRAVQAALLPPDCPSCGHASVAAAFRPASGEVGGDFHDSIPLGGADAYLIGDVTGHGPAAALVMAVLYGATQEAVRAGGREPHEILARQDRLLRELGRRSGGPRLFSATAWLGILDADGTLRHASAGHPPALLLRADGTVERLAATAPPLGFAESDVRAVEPTRLGSGDRVLLYTDGVFAAEDDAEAIEERVLDLAALQPAAFVDALVADGADDDRTAVLVSYAGSGR